MHRFGWRDLFDIAVRWRQISEPLDSVWWIDLLKEESFREGFGSQTPMILGKIRDILQQVFLNATICLNLSEEFHVYYESR